VISDNYHRYLCLSVDVCGYGQLNDPQQGKVHLELADLLDQAAQRAGLRRASWIRQARGDEELALIPEAEPHVRVVDSFVPELAALLSRRNCDKPAGEQLSLRLALDHGLVAPDAFGASWQGQPVVAVSRLVSASQVKALAASGAGLTVVLSRGVYRDLVLAGHTSLRPDLFRRVDVQEKEFSDPAWVWLPGREEPGAVPEARAAARRPASAPARPLARAVVAMPGPR
jgi:hypothetical protein